MPTGIGTSASVIQSFTPATPLFAATSQPTFR